ncbi:MAG: UDP-N-acetylmuramoyl-tripeptide--D-alanyl-D-alanine ligase [Lachnospiraceae bacterium]|nr:UDP-N-acetylmuramoyl-tripeptide--D-alanyl-D-alanine ligase [Lachnospiraceae bacterium]
MTSITLGDLVEATGGVTAGGYADLSALVTGAVSDNRAVKTGDVFFAYIGENSDGHRYVDAALSAGASGAVVMKLPEELRSDKFYLVVEDTVKATGNLARWYRKRFDIPVVGVTGSVGKTTMKDMLASVLSEGFNAAKTEGNYNNHIGVPRTILSWNEETEAAVVEMGMNHAGEIDYLTRIALPTDAVITNIGDAHIGNLGSRENIFRAKCEIFAGLKEGGTAVLNGDDDFLPGLARDAGFTSRFRAVTVGESRDCMLRAEEIDDSSPDGISFDAVDTRPDGAGERRLRIEVPSPGRHMIYPALAGVVIGRKYGLSDSAIVRGIRDYTPTKMRMEILRLPQGITVYNDTYNANPQSMAAGIETLSRVKDALRVAVIGDMFELGEDTERLHRMVGKKAAESGIDVVVAVGAASKFIAEAAKEARSEAALGEIRVNSAPGRRGPEVYHCPDKASAKAVLDGLVRPDTAFLVKASRGMALEELTSYIREKAEALGAGND